MTEKLVSDNAGKRRTECETASSILKKKPDHLLECFNKIKNYINSNKQTIATTTIKPPKKKKHVKAFARFCFEKKNVTFSLYVQLLLIKNQKTNNNVRATEISRTEKLKRESANCGHHL